jgi:serine/threonine protein kinase
MWLIGGAQFAGYTVVRLLGAGGMGEVYLARHPRQARQHHDQPPRRRQPTADPSRCTNSVESRRCLTDPKLPALLTTVIQEHSDLVVIFGGRSEIGIELALRLAAGATVALAGRGHGVLDDQIQALRNAGAAAVHTTTFDADDLTSHAGLLERYLYLVKRTRRRHIRWRPLPRPACEKLGGRLRSEPPAAYSSLRH